MFCVPTLDIDVIWHSHHLTADKYSDDCVQFVKRFINQCVSPMFRFQVNLLSAPATGWLTAYEPDIERGNFELGSSLTQASRFSARPQLHYIYIDSRHPEFGWS
jgi:Glycine-rich domain-containing protein-like